MTELLNSAEYSFLKEDERLGNNLILLGYGGSHAYGTNIPTSDTDIRGVALRCPNDILLGKDFETVTDNATDTVIYSFDKILSLLSECNPNCIEILGLRPQDYLYVTDTGNELLKNKGMFLSKHCINTFGGYATQQLYRLRQKTLDALSPEEYNGHIAKTIKGMGGHLESSWHIPADRLTVRNAPDGLKVDIKEMNDIPLEDFYGMCNEINNTIRVYHKHSQRNEKALAHAKIEKHAMHLLRLYMMAIDLREKEEIITYRADEHDLLMSIRNGAYTDRDTGMMTRDFWELLSGYEARFDEAKKHTRLPEHPDYKSIENFRLRVNRDCADSRILKEAEIEYADR